MIFSIMTFSIVALSIMTFCIMTLSIMGLIATHTIYDVHINCTHPIHLASLY